MVEDKKALRRRLLRVRRGLSPATYAERARLLRDRVLADVVAGPGTTVGAYVSTSEEPGTEPLLTALHEHGTTVLLPVLLESMDLDWARFDPDTPFRRGRFGIAEPDGPPLGQDAVNDASVLLCPGLAADPAGHRLGRGGGSYDRVLARLAALPRPPLRVLLLYDDEVLAEVPVAPHDQPVDVIVTPRRTVRATPASGSASPRSHHGPRTG